jgi:hypothetical protein
VAEDAGKEELVAVIERNGLNQTTQALSKTHLGLSNKLKTAFKE